jgi:hypothetical protein
MRGRQIGWTKKQQVPFDFAQGRLFASVARQAGARGMTISFKTRLQNNFQFLCPFSRAKPLSPVKAVIKAAYKKEEQP